MRRKKGWYWPWLIVGFMTLVVGANLVMVWVAASDPSFAVEPNYYQKALEWDAKREQDRTNADLGWSLGLDVDPARGADGRVGVTARLLDAEGEAIAGARIRVEAFHNARAAHVLEGEMRPTGDDGTYTATMPLRRPGLWEFRVEVLQGERRFTRTLTKELYWR